MLEKLFVLHVSDRKQKKIKNKKNLLIYQIFKITKISVSFLKVIYGSGSTLCTPRRKHFMKMFTYSDNGLC